MPRINVEIEDDVIITVAEFFEEMDDEDIKEMKSLIGMEEKRAAYNEDFDKAAEKLIGNSWRLTLEDENTIKRIANKIVC
jgi:hypothetical protein